MLNQWNLTQRLYSCRIKFRFPAHPVSDIHIQCLWHLLVPRHLLTLRRIGVNCCLLTITFRFHLRGPKLFAANAGRQKVNLWRLWPFYSRVV